MKFLIAVFPLVLAGCDSIIPHPIAAETREFEIVKVNPPKHFSLDLKDVKTGRVYKTVSIQKHCDDWRKAKIGSRWNFLEVKYQRGDEIYKDVKQIGNFCEKLKQL